MNNYPIRSLNVCKKDEFIQDDFDYCKKEFENFLEMQYPKISNINERIEEFCKNFCFDDLYDGEKINKLCDNEDKRSKYIKYSYGSNSKDTWDCDDTHLARVVLFLIHNSRANNDYSLPDLNKFIDIGSGYRYKYRGDTLNTYSTLFGSKNQGYNKFFEQNKEIEDFRRKYVTIGNFMLLPALSLQLDENKRKWDSLNTFRGINERYRDFFDLFISRLINGDKDFEPWKDEIPEYFSFINDTEKFIKANMLEDYFENGTKNVLTNKFGHKNIETPYYWYMEAKIDDAEYRRFALKYIDIATKIIEHRAAKMIEILKGVVNEQ